MKRKIVKFCFITLIVGFVSSCSSDDMIGYYDQVSNVENTKNIVESKNKNAEDLAVLLNRAIQFDHNLLQLIQEKTKSKFDGDYDVLIAELFQNKDTELAKGIIKGIQKARAATTQDTVDLENLINSILKDNPLLQIYMPDWGDLSQYDDFLIVVQPKNANDTEGYELTAYNNKGEKLIVHSNVEPELPYLVISDNERVTIETANVNTDNSALLQTPYYIYNLNNNLLSIDNYTDEKKINVNKRVQSSATSTKRSVFDFESSEYITMARFRNKEAIQNVEPWTRGQPEVFCKVYYQKLGSLADAFTSALFGTLGSFTMFDMGETGWYKGSRTWSFGSWYAVDNYRGWKVGIWTKEAILSKMLYTFAESDGNIDISLNFNTIEQDINFSVAAGQSIGRCYVYFSDPLGKKYETVGSNFLFIVEQKKV